MNPKKAVIFDMYGVIVKDPTGGLSDYMSRVSSHVSHDMLYGYWIPASRGEMTSAEFFTALGFADPAAVESDYIDTIEIDPALFPTVSALRQNGFKTAILSNDIAEWNRALRRKHHLDELFDAVTVSGEERLAKPDRDIYLLTAARLGVSPDACIYIDDREHFLDAAAALGMHPILFNSRNVTYHGDTIHCFADLLKLLHLPVSF